jgi:redox-regulated HSP33 family molecular chaperone
MSVPQMQSSISAEVAWLGFFLAVFVALVYLLERLLVPHHFNAIVAILLAAMLAGFALIGARAKFGSRLRKG